MESNFVDWLTTEVERRGWNNSELARRAGVGHSTVSQVLSLQQNPGLGFCIGVARAFDIPPEDVLRLAGLLPPLPPAVKEEREIVRLIRSIGVQAREVVMAQLRALAGVPPAPANQVAEERAAYQVDEPRTLPERLAQDIAQQLSTMPPEDQNRVIDLMRRLSGDHASNHTVHEQ